MTLLLCKKIELMLILLCEKERCCVKNVTNFRLNNATDVWKWERNYCRIKHDLMITLMHKNGKIIDEVMLLLCNIRTLMCEK